MNYKKMNVWLGWILFLIASVTYLSTIEPTTSFWDCGEFIATSYKLEVGHPPGAPLFMLIARLFSIVGEAIGGTESIAISVNILSALCSAFTILFLFWTITAFTKKMALRGGGTTLDNGKIVAILGSGLVGALAYTFSDSFWFSAVEGEVYAMSSFFTAIVFWAIMKWDGESKTNNNYRWIVLIAYLMGLSIGVHLLNLLAIPAMAYVVYFKNFKETNLKGFVLTGLISMVILAFIQVGVIPGTVKLLSRFEMFFVNKLGMNFYSGVFVFFGAVIAFFAFLISYSRKKGKPILHMATLSVLVMLIGYSSFTMITIRSLANPPMDENNPENVFSMLSYLNREQYGDRPLLYGPYWMAPPKYKNQAVVREDGEPMYIRSFSVAKSGKTIKTFNNEYAANQFIKNNKGEFDIKQEYIVSDPKKGTKIVYDDKYKAFLPRMYSSQPNHIREYIKWSGFTPKYNQDRRIINKPSAAEDLRFMARFQFNWLYWRYFMWNFSGRQNDTQGHGNILDGNWLSGINKIDNQRLGNQDHLPASFTENRGYNKFYMIPLLIGLIGFVFQLQQDKKSWWVLFLLFFFAGIAIMIYLNSYPYQPRERDYAFVGSFYAFAMWIGLGVYAIFDFARDFSRENFFAAAGVSIGSGLILLIIENLTGSEHTISFSILFLAISASIIMAVMKFGLGGTKGPLKAYFAVAIGLVAPFLMAFEGWDDHDRSLRKTGVDFAKNYLESCEPNAIIFTNGDNDTFPLWYAQEVEGIRTDIRVVNLSLLNTDWYVDQCKRKAYDSDPVPFSMEEPDYRQGTRDAVYVNKQSKDTLDVREAIKHIIQSDRQRTPYGDFRVLMSNKLRLPIDKQMLLDKGIVKPEDADKIVDEIVWKIDGNMIYKNNLMMLDLLASFNWERPIYYAVTTGPDSYINLDPYFELTGLAYKLTPFKHKQGKNTMILGGIDTETMYDNVMNKFSWGNMDKETIYMDENNRRMTNNLRIQMSNLAEQLIIEEKNDKAKQILDKTMEVMPPRNVPLNRFIIPIVNSYATIGDNERAVELATELLKVNQEKMDYYSSLNPKFLSKIKQEVDISAFVAQTFDMMVTGGDLTGVSEDFKESTKYIMSQYRTIDEDIKRYNIEQKKLKGRKGRGRKGKR